MIDASVAIPLIYAHKMVNETPISPPSDEDEIGKRVKELELSLPREKGIISNIYFYQNFWCPSVFFSSTLSAQAHFQARDTDIILASKPKSGTSWLKAVAFSILNRTIFPTSNNQDHPLLSNNPHELVPFLESTPISDEYGPPRLIATHLPYNALPESIKSSGCRIVYISRNVLDTAVSLWAFSRRIQELAKEEGSQNMREEDGMVSLEECVDNICKGVDDYGPYWDHVLGYWKESLERPDKVLFLKYEDMKADVELEMKKLAEFIGCGFSVEEQEGGAIEHISKLCSFGNLKELEVHKNGRWHIYTKNSYYFRKGEVGDWINHVSPSMAQRLQETIQDKFQGSGLTFKY